MFAGEKEAGRGLPLRETPYFLDISSILRLIPLSNGLGNLSKSHDSVVYLSICLL